MKISGIYILLTHLSSCFAPALATNVSQSLWDFAKKMYRIVGNQDKNLIFSPFSAHAILSLAYEGVHGDTMKSFRRKLRVSGRRSVRHEYKTILNHLMKSQNDSLYLANKVFIRDGYTVSSKFRSLAKNYFLSDVQTMNFRRRSRTARAINEWVERKTNYKIKDIVSPKLFAEEMVILLINALYFKNAWQYQFNADNTYSDTFYKSETDTMRCHMLHQENIYLLGDNQKLKSQILKMNFANERYSIIFVLPTAKTGLAELEQQLVSEDLSMLTKQLIMKLVMVSIPKFNFETAWTLKEPLKQMGFDKIFAENADFSRMVTSPTPAIISEVIQRAFIDVAEYGIEAVAATAIEIEDYDDTDTEELASVKFKADHPFLFYIIFESGLKNHSDDNYILFMGKVITPSEATGPDVAGRIKRPYWNSSGPYVRSSQLPREPSKLLLFLQYFITITAVSLMIIKI